MERLDLIHHKAMLLVILLVTLVMGVVFGVKISATTRGTDGLLIIVFAMLFVIMAASFIIFTQLIHLREEVRTLGRPQHTESLKKASRDNPSAMSASSAQGTALTKNLTLENPKRSRR